MLVHIIIIMLFHNVCALFILTVLTFPHRICNAGIISNYYRSYPCNHQTVSDVISSSAISEESHQSLLRCASACNSRSNTECNSAVYFPSNSSCILISLSETLLLHLSDSLDSDTAKLKNCTLISINIKNTDIDTTSDLDSCQNGGQRFNFTCICPKEFSGRYCEKGNPAYCQNGEWKLVTEQDYSMLSTSQIPMKIEYGSKMMWVKSFRAVGATGSNFAIQVNDYLAFDDSEKGLEDPWSMVFLLIDVVSGTIRQAKVNSVGEITENSPLNQDVNLYMPSVLDEQRVVVGTIQDVVDALSKGHQLFQRGFSYVGFNSDTNDAFVDNIYHRLVIDEIDQNENLHFKKPLNYISFRESLTTNTRYVIHHNMILDTYSLVSNQNPITPKWELDKCWNKIEETGDDQEFTSVLTEYITRGYEIRVVLDGKMPSYIAEIRTFADGGMLAQVGIPYASPFDSERGLDANSTIRRSVIGRSSSGYVISECEQSLQSTDAFRLPLVSYTKSVDWYVSTKPWTKIYSVSLEQGGVLYGNVQDLYHAATVGKTIRVCMYRTLDSATCQGGVAIKTAGDPQLVFQTYPVYLVKSNGRIYHSYCSRRMRLVKTDGSIVMAGYNFGAASNNYPRDTPIKIDWFVEG